MLFAPVKGDRPEWVVQKLTELGADTIVPLVAERSVVVWPAARIGHQLDRLRRISREAAMQSRQCYLPEVAAPSRSPTPRCSTASAWHTGRRLASDLARPDGARRPRGWLVRRRARLGLPSVGLGPGVLRAETAAVAAGVLLAALRSAWCTVTLGEITSPIDCAPWPPSVWWREGHGVELGEGRAQGRGKGDA